MSESEIEVIIKSENQLTYKRLRYNKIIILNIKIIHNNIFYVLV